MNETTKHLTEEDLVLLHYGESQDRAAVARHVLSCGRCREQYDALLRTLEAVDALPLPEREPGYGADVWQRLQPGLAAVRPRPSRLTVYQRWAVAASVLLMLAAGLVGGRLWRTGGVAPAGPIPEQSRERILLLAVGEHLDRTQMMLVEVVNEQDLDLPAARERAGELLASNRLYRQSLETTDPALASVLEDLERVLLDIVHETPDRDGELERVRSRIEKQGLVFKVRILGTQVRRQEEQIRTAASGNRT